MVDERKLGTPALSELSDAQSVPDTDDSPESMGRLRNPLANRLDLGSSLNDDDDAISRMAKRFRGPGVRFSQPDLDSEPSLDSQPAQEAELSSEELQGFLLDVLEDPPADFELEEFAEEAQTLESHSPSAQPAQASQTAEQARSGAPISSATDGISCPSCGASNPDGMRFCVQCGGSLATRANTFNSAQVRQVQPPSAASKQPNPWDIELISINEDGSDGISIPLKYLETIVGCDGDTRFPTDAFLSPQHARLYVEDGKLFIEDLDSLNGTFLKLHAEIRLSPGDSFLMGRQVLRFERFEQEITPKTKSPDGTRYMGSPAPGGKFKILQIGIGNVVQNVYCLPDSGAVLGRENGDIIFPHDKFMSSRHAQIYTGEDGHCYMVDLNSSNGSWTKIWEKTRLNVGDYIFMGQQLFRAHFGKA